MGRPAGRSYHDRVADKVEAAQAVLQREVAALVSGEDWCRFLAFQARLHTYSANNVMLIAAQHAVAFAEGRVAAPLPSWVAGFRTWRALGRSVNQGQHGYAVLAPVRRVRRTAIDAAGNERPLGRRDLPTPEETEQRQGVLRGFRLEYVFDVSQTGGAELPDIPTPRLLEGSAPSGLREALVEMIERQGFSVAAATNAQDLDGANGVTRWDSRTVTVRSDMSDSAQVKTLIHEAAHVLLHEGPPGRFLPRPVKEVEAESVAFVVAAVHGMSTDGYSFPYVAAWAGEGASKTVAATQARVGTAAKAIIAVSPAEHDPGGKAPGVEAVVLAARERKTRGTRGIGQVGGRRYTWPGGHGPVQTEAAVMAGRHGSSDLSADAPMFAVAAAVAVAAVLWMGGAAAARLSGHRVPPGRPWAAVAAFADPGDPSVAWHAPVGGPVLYWSITALVVAAVAALITGGWWLWHGGRRAVDDPTRIEGLATRRDPRAAAGAKSLTGRAGTLRPAMGAAAVEDLGYFLGVSKGVQCWASVEDSIFLLGPPRSGKGLHLVIPSIFDAPGAVITTATRADNLAVTLSARKRQGPVGVFDPQGLAGGVPASLRWSPIRGCERPQTAMIRALALCADAGEGTESGAFWKQQTVAAVRCLLHAAALDNRPPADLYLWSLAAPAASEAVDILVHSPRAAQAWDRALDAIISADQRQRDSVWAMVANAFAALADPHVLDAVSPAPGEQFNPAEFLRSKGTLYLLGTASGATSTATLVAALVEDVVEVARRLAAASIGGRLDPPLCLILDEAANYPLPSLPALMSEGGGTGITTIAVLQSLDQARHRWGRDAAGAIWDSATVKLVMPGVSSAEDLADIARLIGDRPEREFSETSQAGGGKSVSSSTRHRAILEPSALRTLTPGHALVLLRSVKPMVLSLRPWTTRRDAPRLRSDRQHIESVIRAAADATLGELGDTDHA